MKDVIQQVFVYFGDNILATLAIAFVAGYAAAKTVTIGKRGGLIIFFGFGLVGAVLGQFSIMYLGIKEVLEQVPEFRLIFDFIAAYIGSFIVASLVRFARPL